MKFSGALILAALVPANALTREPFSRRGAISAAACGVAGGLLSQVQPSFAATTPPTKEELDRIVLGYKQITALLNDFEASTTVCRENGGECKRDAEPIREFLSNVNGRCLSRGNILESSIFQEVTTIILTLLFKNSLSGRVLGLRSTTDPLFQIEKVCYTKLSTCFLSILMFLKEPSFQ